MKANTLQDNNMTPNLHQVTSLDIDVLDRNLATAQATLGVIGLGYVGIPLVMAMGQNGFQVIGFDINKDRVDQLNRGISPIGNISHLDIKAVRDAHKFEATTDFAQVKQADAIIICVPTPLTKQREPDMTYITDTAETIANYLRPGQLIVLESTTYPGTTSDVMVPILEKGSGLKAGEDFFVAFSPEREDPGNEKYSVATMPKVVGGDSPHALRLAATLYGKITNTVVKVSSTPTAEAVKLTENIFRAVNIALVNELKIIYDAMGIDIWEVIEAAKTKPFGFMPFYPGPGLGGHCIPIDPFYLTWKAREFDISTRFIELAGEINASMPRHVVNVLSQALSDKFQKSIKGARVLLVGLAYKKNIEDMRESPALRIFDILNHMGASVDYHDPYVPTVPDLRHYPQFKDKHSINLTQRDLEQYDAVFIATDHDNIDYRLIVDNSPLVIDTRNICERLGLKKNHVIKA